MQPGSLVIAAMLGLLLLAYVLYPLYRHPVSASQEEAQEPTRHLSEREQNARQALQEVEFDFQLGNLEEHEYRSLRTRYMRRALVEMKQRHLREQELDAEIEAQLQALKQAESAEGEEHEQV
jgi:hypothetical protein